MAEYKKEGYSMTFYPGGNYGFSEDYGSFLGMSYRTPASNIGQATDPRTANQLKVVSEKINTGGKVIEMSPVQPNIFEAIPNQHLEELNRLKKLTGTEITLHGPLVEPTGVSRQGWNESQREQAERQMLSAVMRAHKLDPKGNIVVTFHSSNGLPEPETKVMREEKDPLTGKKEMKEITTDFWVVDERSGQFNQLHPKFDYLRGEPENPESLIEKHNKEVWAKTLQQLNFHAEIGQRDIKDALGIFRGERKDTDPESLELLQKITSEKPLNKLYRDYITGKDEKILEEAEKYGPQAKRVLQAQLQKMTSGDIYVRDAYQDLQNLYNQAYAAAEKNNDDDAKEKLNTFRKKIGPHLSDVNDPTKVDDFADYIVDGVRVLRSITPPQTLKPLKDFAVEKASETFSNIAYKAYKEFGDSAPIISIENPPVGMGLARADDLRQVIDETRSKFIEKAKEEGMSESEAKKQAEKLIGVTWDVGHINMLRKYGYEDKALIEQTKKLTDKQYIKHVHLSDNFGLEHTELPMGMGNVPTKGHMELIDKYNKQVKKIIETGDWFQHFQTPPVVETLSAFGSPLYSMKMAPYWNQVSGMSGGYFSGIGATLPDVNFQTYGTSFTTLPVELGGQMQGRNRLSGNPME